MINVIWLFMIAGSLIYKVLTKDVTSLNKEMFTFIQDGIKLVINMAPSIILWMGIMALASKSGLFRAFGKLMEPLLSKLFPELDKNSKSLSYISSNIVCNMLGMGSAATPFGLKAMEEMQKENKCKDTATTSMITFLVLNTAGVTIIPTTVIALRVSLGSISPTKIILPSLIATFISSVTGLSLDYFIRKKRRNS